MQVQYQPVDSVRYRPPIRMVGCGGITRYHLEAYQKAGYDIRRSAAEQRTGEFFPGADVDTDDRDLFRRDDIEVVDITTHPPNDRRLCERAGRQARAEPCTFCP